jgi:predicted Zn-dependent peptidase
VLVRERELATGAGSSALQLIGGHSFGFASARARDGVEPDLLEEAMAAEVARFIAEGPTAEEVRRARAQFERFWLQSLAGLATRADQISAAATLLDDPHRINTRIHTVTSIDGEEIRAAAAEHLSPEHRATLLYRKEETR